ncbi:Gfo/Idh/MocA family protein [Mesorhizobium sp. BR1-1-2]|uniref:Gfo/Idh/MocA family protein n=1 Tax=Mesorhizobium sp. BR1-1-2 TaxID=2876652 RepID=UPI001CC9C7C9|nr:Gfo/Idh/MocA family oxidoreductase [Mesorhizobium sp. BR1-1-2]MBZ9965886.1 Gfo/Idh/MocA family oxidoreductase [Mesorhizobium sp. BR1-1-2]
MKILLIGVGHWHTPLYLAPLLEQPGVEISGVSDPDIAVARRFGEQLACAYATRPGELHAGKKPDLAFVLGRHSDMATEVASLIAAEIPFVVEKPAGLNEAEVRNLAISASAAGVFNAVPLVFRSSGFVSAIRQRASGEKLLYADFKFVAGLPSRYHEAGCSWVFDRKQSGGGVLLNLGVHFIDLFQHLTSVDNVCCANARLANLQGEGDVDDYANLTLLNRDRLCRVEAAYLYPAPGGVFDMHFSARTEAHYFRTNGPGVIEISDLKGRRETIDGSTTNMPLYPLFVADVIEQVRNGVRPVADLGDMANVMSLVDDAYRIGGV